MFKKLTMTAAAAAMFVAGMVGQAAAGEVTLRVTGIVLETTMGTTIANFEAFVMAVRESLTTTPAYLVGPPGLEPGTVGLKVRCSTS